MRAEGDQHVSDHRLARGDAAGEADFQHEAAKPTTFTTKTQRDGENLAFSFFIFLRVFAPPWWALIQCSGA